MQGLLDIFPGVTGGGAAKHPGQDHQSITGHKACTKARVYGLSCINFKSVAQKQVKFK